MGMENMIDKVTLLGDVHLDKKFRTGVPLHRMGEREEMVWKQFEESLATCTNPLHVQVGDLFDQMSVSEMAVLRAANMYQHYAGLKPNTKFVIYRGNHDASRDTNKKSSFDVFAELMEGTPNVTVFRDVVGVVTVEGRNYGFLPWHPFKTADQLAFDLIAFARKRLDAVFCHCDIDSFGGNDDNLIPTRILNQITDTVVTGHVHTPDDYKKDGVRVIVTGSMQPYNHSEDLSGVLYKTLTLEQYGLVDLEQLKNMNIRILLEPGQILPPAPDCLSFIGKTVTSVDPDDEDDSEVEVGFNAFDMDEMFRGIMLERGVGQDVADKIYKKYEELKVG